MSEPDPRVFFAAERTLLAWLRSGLTVIGLGFVVARFGLFLHLIRQQQAAIQIPAASTAIGVGLVALGVAMIAGAAWQHVRFCRTLELHERPAEYWTGFALWIAATSAALGIALAVYLLWGVTHV